MLCRINNEIRININHEKIKHLQKYFIYIHNIRHFMKLQFKKRTYHFMINPDCVFVLIELKLNIKF